MASTTLVAALLAIPGRTDVPGPESHVREIFKQMKTVYSSELRKQDYPVALKVLPAGVADLSEISRRDGTDTILIGLTEKSLRNRTQIAVTLCHELGHLVGGAPWGLYKNFTFEGQADYFAFSKCLKRLWESEDNAAIVASLTLDPRVAPLCENRYGAGTRGAFLCMRSVHAAIEATRDIHEYYLTIKRASSPPLLEFHEPHATKGKYATRSFPLHPTPQCRLETMVAGALCDVDPTVNFKNSDATVGACNGEEIGARPACWYFPRAARDSRN